MKSKIHRATVTHADLHYVGSLTVSRDLMDAANLFPGEKVDVVDINNGARLSTYVIEGPANAGIIGINGAAARLISQGDLVIIIAYARVPVARARSLSPRVVFVDADNRIRGVGSDPADAPACGDLERGDQSAPPAGRTIWFTGLPSAGKSTLATQLTEQLTGPVQLLDGDVVRREFFPELGFSQRDRTENVRRTGRLAAMLASHGVTVLVPVIAPWESARRWVRRLHADAGLDYLEVWVDAPVEVCAERDVKGLYARARRGDLTGLTGVDDPYEPPTDADLRLRTDLLTITECVRRLHALLRGNLAEYQLTV